MKKKAIVEDAHPNRMHIYSLWIADPLSRDFIQNLNYLGCGYINQTDLQTKLQTTQGHGDNNILILFNHRQTAYKLASNPALNW